MPPEMISVCMEIDNQSVREEMERILSSTGGFQLRDPGPSRSCSLWIFEIGKDLKQEFQLIRSVESSGAAKAIFLTSPLLESYVLIEALRAGAKEFFSQPIKGEEVRSALMNFKEEQVKISSLAEKKLEQGHAERKGKERLTLLFLRSLRMGSSRKSGFLKEQE